MPLPTIHRNEDEIDHPSDVHSTPMTENPPHKPQWGHTPPTALIQPFPLISFAKLSSTMKYISSPGLWMVITICQTSVYGQPIFNTTMYEPVPLPAYALPRDSSMKENSLVRYNMDEQKFDTIRSWRDTHSPHPSSPSPLYRHEKTKPVGDLFSSFEFSNLQPADQLPEFPDYPSSAIVKLFLTFFNPVNQQNSFGTCSGIMIHPEYILTGGHCVKSLFDSSYVISCTVVPAYNLGSLPFGTTTTTDWYAFSQWTMNGNLDYDIAIMHLADPIGNETGWMDLAYTPDDSFFTADTNVFFSFGYPGYDAYGNPAFEEGERMYYMTGHMDYFSAVNTVCHYNIGYQGQSGSGFFHQDSTGRRNVYGVLSHGSGIATPAFTCHCRMDSAMFNHFNSIVPVVSDLETVSHPKEILIYPNPSNGLFTLDFSQISHSDITLKVFDVWGRQISIVPFDQASTMARINLTAFPAGTYIIQATLDGNTAIGRLCKIE